MKKFLIRFWENEEGFVAIGTAVATAALTAGAKKLIGGSGGSGSSGGFSVPLADFSGLMTNVTGDVGDSISTDDGAIEPAQTFTPDGTRVIEKEENTSTQLQQAWGNILASNASQGNTPIRI